MQTKLGHINRAVAAILSLVWACAGITGLVAAYVYGRWMLVVPALFGLWYAALWAHVVARSRLLTWSEIAMPWRAR
jgi:hypothetical protein